MKLSMVDITRLCDRTRTISYRADGMRDKTLTHGGKKRGTEVIKRGNWEMKRLQQLSRVEKLHGWDSGGNMGGPVNRLLTKFGVGRRSPLLLLFRSDNTNNRETKKRGGTRGVGWVAGGLNDGLVPCCANLELSHPPFQSTSISSSFSLSFPFPLLSRRSARTLSGLNSGMAPAA